MSGPEPRGYDHAAADVRAKDAAWGGEPKMRALAEEAGVKLISLRPLRDLRRAGAIEV